MKWKALSHLQPLSFMQQLLSFSKIVIMFCSFQSLNAYLWGGGLTWWQSKILNSASTDTKSTAMYGTMTAGKEWISSWPTGGATVSQRASWRQVGEAEDQSHQKSHTLVQRPPVGRDFWSRATHPTLQRWDPQISGFGNLRGLCPEDPGAGETWDIPFKWHGLACSRIQHKGSS